MISRAPELSATRKRLNFWIIAARPPPRKQVSLRIQRPPALLLPYQTARGYPLRPRRPRKQALLQLQPQAEQIPLQQQQRRRRARLLRQQRQHGAAAAVA